MKNERNCERNALLWVAAILFVAPILVRAAEPLTVGDAMAASYAPVVRVVDTVSSLGPMAPKTQTVTIEDLVRYHGHPCDGLVVAAAGIAFGLQTLFPGEIVDRTDLVVAVNRSPCYGDVAEYMTGARLRYGSLTIDPKLGDRWILYRRSTDQTVSVHLRAGVKPAELADLEKQLRRAACPEDLMTKVQTIQKDFAIHTLSAPPGEIFALDPLSEFPYPVGTPRPDSAKARCGQEKNRVPDPDVTTEEGVE
ncbi:MAG: hypothetical protein DRJ61_14475 [Acidobacteria bacterium]|nr:MAG: hypothetical protein DRJ61_14475 [Acidobacteriota bacterium]